MNYKLLDNHRVIRKKFLDQFIASYSEFLSSHSDWVSKIPIDFTETFFEKMFMWDRLRLQAREIPFDDAIRLLRCKNQEVLFLTESPKCVVREFCKLNNREEYVAAAAAAELADRAEYEWYAEYELAEKGRYLANSILPTDLYIFDESFSWCIILTHETDETESAASRFCLFIGE